MSEFGRTFWVVLRVRTNEVKTYALRIEVNPLIKSHLFIPIFFDFSVLSISYNKDDKLSTKITSCDGNLVTRLDFSKI